MKFGLSFVKSWAWAMVTLSEAQWNVMIKLLKGERVTVIPAITRRWLQHQGYITVDRTNKKGPKFRIEITELGRQIMTTAQKEKLS